MPLAQLLFVLAGLQPQTDTVTVGLDVVARGRLEAATAGASNPPRARFEFASPSSEAVSIAVRSLEFDACLRFVGGPRDGKELRSGGFLGDVWAVVEVAAAERIVMEVTASDARGGEFEVLVSKDVTSPWEDVHARKVWMSRARAAVERAAARGELVQMLELQSVLAEMLFRAGPLDQALAAYQRVEELAGRLERPEVVWSARATSASLRWLLGGESQALEEFERLESESKAAPPQARARLLLAFGQALFQSGAPSSARSKLEAAIAAASPASPREEGLARACLAACIAALPGGDESALDRELARAEEIARNLRDDRLRAEVWFARGHARLSRGQARDALDALDRALELDLPPLRRADALATSGQALVLLQRPFDARRRFAAALALADEVGAKHVTPEHLLSFADLELAFGEFDLAVDLLESAAEALAGAGHELRRAEVLTSLGQARLLRADSAPQAPSSESDRRLAGEAAEHVIAIGKKHGELRVQVQGAILACGTGGRNAPASAAARRALDELAALTGERGELALDALISGQRAWDDYLAMRDADAVRMGERAYSVFALLEENERCLAVLDTIAQAALRLRDADRLASALDRAELRMDREALQRGSAREIAALRAAHASFEALAHDLVALRLEIDDTSEHEFWRTRGFEAAGAWKSRSLVETLVRSRRGARSTDDAARRAARAALAAARGKLEELARERAAPDSIASALASAGLALERLEASEIAARGRSIETDPHRTPHGRPPSAVRSTLIGSRALFVEYVAGTVELYAYVLTHERLEFVRLGPRAEIESDAARFVRAASAEGPDANIRRLVDLGVTLYSRLVRPVFDRAGGIPAEWIIVPTEGLASLPFEALITAAPPADAPQLRFAELAFLVRDCAVAYAPSAPVLVELATTRPNARARTALVCADPEYAGAPTGGALLAGSPREAPASEAHLTLERLAETRAEAVSIANLLLDTTAASGAEDALAILAIERGERDHMRSGDGFELLLGKEATAERFIMLAPRYNVLHLAMHALGTTETGADPALAFAHAEPGRGRLACDAILALSLDADLVVLAGCETATGRAIDGQGVQSLASAFLHAGARSVVATQWRVRDRESRALMQRFYRGLLKEGLPPTRALRAGKLALLNGEGGRGGTVRDRSAVARLAELADPYYWAAFVYMGLPE